MGEALSVNLVNTILELNWRADAVVPIPSSLERLQQRGYNQVDQLARPLARFLGWPFLPAALQRTRDTRSQVGLSGDARRKNVVGAFQSNPHLVSGKTILLVDDIATTGATLNASSKSLVEAGAARVYAITLARALPKFGLDSTYTHSSRRN